MAHKKRKPFPVPDVISVVTFDDGQWGQMPYYIWVDPNLRGRDKQGIGVLYFHRNWQDNTCFPSIETICKEGGLSRNMLFTRTTKSGREIEGVLPRLVRLKYIMIVKERSRYWGERNRYILLDKPEFHDDRWIETYAKNKKDDDEDTYVVWEFSTDQN